MNIEQGSRAANRAYIDAPKDGSHVLMKYKEGLEYPYWGYCVHRWIGDTWMWVRFGISGLSDDMFECCAIINPPEARDV